MNERIRKLAEQAKAFIVEPEQAKIGEVSEVSFDKYSDLEKFAELIVRQCADVMINDPRLSDVRSATRGCARSIKEHFGVEE